MDGWMGFGRLMRLNNGKMSRLEGWPSGLWR